MRRVPKICGFARPMNFGNTLDYPVTTSSTVLTSKRWWAVAVTILAAIVLGIGAMRWRSKAATASYAVVAGVRTLQVVGQARLVPEQTTVVSANVAGTVMALPITVGANVKPGDVLFTLANPALHEASVHAQRERELAVADDASLQADLAEQALQREADVLSARHDLAVAEVDLNAYQALLDKGAISAVQVQKYRLQAEQNRAQLAFAIQREAQARTALAAKRQASKTRLALAEQQAAQALAQESDLHVPARSSGILSKLSVTPGQAVTAGQAVAEVMSPNLRVDIQISQGDANAISPGMRVALDASQGQAKAIVTDVQPRAADGNVHVLARLLQPPAWVRADIECEATLSKTRADRGLFVQAPAGARANDTVIVDRLAPSGKTVAVSVHFGARYGGELQVLSGLRAGDRIAQALPNVAGTANGEAP